MSLRLWDPATDRIPLTLLKIRCLEKVKLICVYMCVCGVGSNCIREGDIKDLFVICEVKGVCEISKRRDAVDC